MTDALDRLRKALADRHTIERELAAALSHAHSLDIIHRDITPENILLQDGRPA